VRYYIITGEPSGDMHASNLVSELKKIDKKSVVRAWGGDRLIAEGVSLAKNIKETAFMGLWNVISNLSSIRSNLNFCKKDILDFKVDALILVDYPGFNLKIAEFAKKSGIKVFYYISPKV
jgi:lipid-A-disaccharide synthase